MAGVFFPVADIKKITDKKGKMQRVEANVSYSFYPEHNNPFCFIKPRKVITTRGRKGRK